MSELAMEAGPGGSPLAADERLKAFLQAASDLEAEPPLRILLALLEPDLRALCDGCREHPGVAHDCRVAAALERIAAELYRYRQAPSVHPISELHRYSAFVLRALEREARRAGPAALLDVGELIRDLCRPGNPSGLARWETRAARSGYACGFLAWQARRPDPAAPAYERLRREPGSVAAAEDGSHSLPGLTASLLRAVGGPIAEEHLVAMVAACLGSTDGHRARVPGLVAAADPADALVAVGPDDWAVHRALLDWLKDGILGLSLPHRRAWLLGSGITHDLEEQGVMSRRELAELAGIPLALLEEEWHSLPLGDRALAAIFPDWPEESIRQAREGARARLAAAAQASLPG